MITAIVMMNVERKSISKIIDELIKIDGITEVYPIAGEYDLVAIIRTKKTETLSRILAETLPHHIEDILATRTLITLGSTAKIDLEKAFDL